MQWFPKLKLRDWAIILGVVVVYFALTTYHLTLMPIFVDESLYLRWAQIAWHDASWRFISLTDGKQPLWMWVAIPFLRVIADPLMAGRLLNVFCGLVTMLATAYGAWLVTKKKTIAFWSMIAVMLSPFLFFYNRFAVVEAMMIAFGVLIFDGSILLARSRRLDVALLLGMVTGLGLLVKSPALFWMLLIPAGYILFAEWKTIWSKETLRYIGLILVVWFLAEVIYNIQRLSPWMYIITQKNDFFVVPYSQIFKNPARIWNNLMDTFRWHFAYTTIPLFFAGVWGMWLLWRAKPRESILTKAWFALPLVGTILVANLYSPRYMVFTVPFLLIFVAVALDWLAHKKWGRVVIPLLFVMPLYLIIFLLRDPVHFPFVDVDQGYINGWSAGNGTKQIAAWAVAKANSGPHVTIFTEGTFGILPEGLELYTDGKTQNLTITGIYPIDAIPPHVAVAHAATDPETYLILNNTVTTSVPDGLELVASYPKLRDNPMRLYHVLAPVPTVKPSSK